MYWITVSNGLIKDKHREKMGSAVWEFMWLLDKMTSCGEDGIGKVLGGKPIKSSEIMKDLGLTRSTINKNINLLETEGYINTLRTPYGLVITIIKAKKIFQKKNRDVNKSSITGGEMCKKVASIEMCKKVANKEDSTAIDNTSNDNTTYTPSGVQELVNYFFELKGWGNKDKSFYEKNRIIYSRFVRPAKELLVLCEQNIPEAKECIRKVGDWAKSRDLDWGIETVFKKWYDLDLLKPKEKQPYYDGKRIFQKVPNGKWWCITGNGEIKELGVYPAEIQIDYK